MQEIDGSIATLGGSTFSVKSSTTPKEKGDEADGNETRDASYRPANDWANVGAALGATAGATV